MNAGWRERARPKCADIVRDVRLRDEPGKRISLEKNAKCFTVENHMAHCAVGYERDVRRAGRNYSGRLSLCSRAGQRGSDFRWSKAGKRMTAVSSSSRSA